MMANKFPIKKHTVVSRGDQNAVHNALLSILIQELGATIDFEKPTRSKNLKHKHSYLLMKNLQIPTLGLSYLRPKETKERRKQRESNELEYLIDTLTKLKYLLTFKLSRSKRESSPIIISLLSPTGNSYNFDQLIEIGSFLEFVVRSMKGNLLTVNYNILLNYLN